MELHALGRRGGPLCIHNILYFRVVPNRVSNIVHEVHIAQNIITNYYINTTQ